MQGCGTRALFFCVFFLPLFPVAAVPKPKATEPPAISSSSGSEKKSNLGQPTPTTNKSAANMTVAEVTTTKSTTPTDDATNDEAVDGDGIQCNEYKCWFLGPPVSYELPDKSELPTTEEPDMAEMMTSKATTKATTKATIEATTRTTILETRPTTTPSNKAPLIIQPLYGVMFFVLSVSFLIQKLYDDFA